MKATELRQKTVKELRNLLLEQSQKQFEIRMKKHMSETSKPQEGRLVRRGIARIQTIINEKERQA
jgi:large subunit ribosomal protein L29